MYQTYTIGELAKVLGITSETIRYYERKKIINPIHDEETGYRYYTTWDLHMIIRARCYLKFGFTIEEVAHLLSQEDIQEIDDILSKQEDILQQQLIYQMNLLKRLRLNRTLIRDSKKEDQQLCLKMSPAIYRINTQINYNLVSSKKHKAEIKKVCENVPFVFSTALFKQENIIDQIDEFDFGIGIEEEFATFLNIKENDYITYHPSRLCLYMCISSRSSQYLSIKVLEPAFAYMKEHNLQLAGDIITQIVSMCKPEEEYFNWHNIWIPVE